MNKYGGVMDASFCDKRIYNLWYQMLRRCYDKDQQTRSRGRSYRQCTVCQRWLYLSNFASDVEKLPGYEQWRNNSGYCLDKDSRLPGNKEYSPDACMFIKSSENIKEANKRTNSIRAAQEANKVVYILERGNEVLVFDSERDACEFLGVKKCSVSSCYHKGYKCKGYKIAKMDGGTKE